MENLQTYSLEYIINNSGNYNKTSSSVDFWIKFTDLASTLFDSGRFVDFLYFAIFFYLKMWI